MKNIRWAGCGAALGVALLLGGCVAAPVGPGVVYSDYGYAGYPGYPGYYTGVYPSVAIGVGSGYWGGRGYRGPGPGYWHGGGFARPGPAFGPGRGFAPGSGRGGFGGGGRGGGGGGGRGR